MVLGELVVGRLPEAVLKDLMRLELLPETSWIEVMDFVRDRGLYGKGLSWTDACLLHACLSREVELITNDKRLKKAYSELRK